MSTIKYIKEIDSLRALAVLAVVFNHWIPNTIGRVPLGGIGVNFFFVLSGFLITKILFESRLKNEILKASNFSIIKNFYIRRTLRIFPIYYFTILIIYVFKNYLTLDFDNALIYCLTYTTNFYFYSIGNWMGIISPLWSLAVEEQFYLVWPWIIVFVNKKYLLHVILIFIAIGLISEYLFGNIPKAELLPNTCFAGFGLGALLAWILVFKKEYLPFFSKFIYCISVIASLLFVLILLNKIHLNIPLRFLTFLASIGLLTYVVLNAGNSTLRLKFFFQNPILLFLGKISYGMYLYHLLIPTLLNNALINKYINPYLPDFIFIKNFKWLFLCENLLLLVLVSWLSFHFIEKKILALKVKFDG